MRKPTVIKLSNGFSTLTSDENGHVMSDRKFGEVYLILTSRREEFGTTCPGYYAQEIPALTIAQLDGEDGLVAGSATHDWTLFVAIDKVPNKIGNFTVGSTKGSNWCMQCSRLSSHQGIGLGKSVYRALANYYGVLESDPNGNTSSEAHRVWRSLGAQELFLDRTNHDGTLDKVRRWSLTGTTIRES